MTREELEYKLNKEQRELEYYEQEITNLKGLRETISESLYNQEMDQFEKYVERIKESIEELEKELESLKVSEDADIKPQQEQNKEPEETITINTYKEEIARNNREIERLNQELRALEAAKTDMSPEEYKRELENINKHLEKMQTELAENKATVNAYNSMRNNIIQLRRLMEEKNEQNSMDFQEEYQRRQAEIDESRKKLSTTLQEQLELELIESGVLSSRVKEQKLRPEPVKESEENIKLNSTNQETIEDYKNKSIEYKQEIERLNQKIEDLKSVKNNMTLELYAEEMQRMQQYISMEQEKLEKNNQIIYEYERMSENLISLEKLNSIVARDDQDKIEMSEERKRREAEIEFSKSILPQSLIDALMNRKKEAAEDKIEVEPIGTPVPNNEKPENGKPGPENPGPKKPESGTPGPNNGKPGNGKPGPEKEPGPKKPEPKNPPENEPPKEYINLNTIYTKLTEDLKIKSNYLKQYKKYTISNIRVSNQFKNQLSSGNYIYDIAHFTSAVITSAVTPIMRIVDRLTYSREAISTIKTLRRRIEELSDNELMYLMTEADLTQLVEKRDAAVITVLLNEKIQRFATQEVRKTNGNLEKQYEQAFSAIAQLDALDEELANPDLSKEQKEKLLEKRSKILEGKAELIQSIRENQKYNNKILTGSSALAFEQNTKAATTKMSVLGKRFSKEHDYDYELAKQEGELEVQQDKAIDEKDDEKALRSFIELEVLKSKNTTIENSKFGKISTGKRYYKPLGGRLDYRDDPLIKDIFSSIAIITAGVGAVNAVKTHLIDDPQVLLQEQQRVTELNIANQEALEQVQQAGQTMYDKSEVIAKGMEAQMNENLITTANTVERQALDQSNWRISSSTYKQLDAANHELYNEAYHQAEAGLQDIAAKYSSGAIEQSKALEMISSLNNETQRTLTTVLEDYVPIMEEYAKANPQFDLTAALEGMKHIVNNPDAITDMNQAMVDMVKTGQSLSGLTIEQATALSSLPSDLQTTLFSSVSSLALVSRVCNTMNEKARHGGYGNKVTRLVDEYIEQLEEEDIRETDKSEGKSR